jgi:hypothetical protein
MNLHEQLGALEMGVDQLIQAVVAPQAENQSETPASVAAPQVAAADQVAVESNAAAGPAEVEAVTTEVAVAEQAPAENAAHVAPTLQINRPAQNEITMTINGQTIALRPEEVGRLIEELSNARASMTPEPPPGIPPGWRFVSTKNPVMAVQKHSNGDRLLVMRHTGHGWVPFTFSPDMVIQLYMMLTKG